MSNFPDTVFFSNEMNKYAALPPVMQYDFYFAGTGNRNRFRKWDKKAKDEDIAHIRKFYNCSLREAASYKDRLNKEDIQFIKRQVAVGGRV